MNLRRNNILISYRRPIVICGLVVLLILFLVYKTKVSGMEVDGWSKDIVAYENSEAIDIDIKKTFLNRDTYTTSQRFGHIFKYFAYGSIKYSSDGGGSVLYPGAISTNGRAINGLEGFARFFPLAAAWLLSSDSATVRLRDENYNLVHMLKKGLLNGTNPESENYWGEVNDRDQRIVEAADIALGLWIARDILWLTLNKEEKHQIVNWLSQSVHKDIIDNNWNLFPITIVKVLEALDYPNAHHLKYVTELYTNYKTKHYLGDGWFDDPPKGIDYYNAWSIHYSLFWIDQIDPSFDRDYIRGAHAQFVKFYKYIFSRDGFPIMGRSVCYRLAAPSPIISGALIVPEEVSTGLAKRTLDLTWSHFIENDVLKDGKLTQGYYQDDLRLLDGYSGAGSCLWSLRSLITAFYVDKHITLFDSEEELLPVEMSDYQVENKTIGWTIIGDKKSQLITLKINKNRNNRNYGLLKYSASHKIREFLFRRPVRPKNYSALYKNYIYTSKAELFVN